MHWTAVGVAALASWLGYLAWFGLVLARRLPAARERARYGGSLAGALGLDVLLLPLIVAIAGATGTALGIAELLIPGLALALWTFAPRPVTSKVTPLALAATGLYGFVVARDWSRTPWPVGQRYGLASPSGGTGYAHVVLFQAWLFLAVGLWLSVRRMDGDSPIRRALLTARGNATAAGRRPRWGLLLLGLVGLLVELFGRAVWLNAPWWSAGLTAVIGITALALVIGAPAIAADLAVAGLILFGLYGIALAIWWPTHVPLPSVYTELVRYGTVWVTNRTTALLAGVQGLALTGLGLWLVPRAIDDRTRALLRSAGDAELAQRVTRLTRSRADAVDTATEQLRQLERDLHDGAQARLVALGMSLRAAERLIPVSPQAAAALVAEARHTSLAVLDELRALVRGICPPVLADRGLADAVRALALDCPLRTEVDVDLPGRPDLPVETACYFAVAEALANAAKHSGARSVHVRIGHDGGRLRIEVTDDGAGGADPRRGSGLAGLERRLGTVDGVIALSSPPGGPTIVAIEVPCALSSRKISTCSGTG